MGEEEEVVVKVASNAERKDICHGTALKVSFSYCACADVDCDHYQIKRNNRRNK